MRVFIASSSEQIAVARKVSEALAVDELTAKVWDEETFDFSAGFIESLEEELERADFAVVVLTADDHATMREKQVDLPRDNVIFELGLFIGRLGRERCFFLIDGSSQTEVASDLSGVNPVKFYGEGAPSSPGRRTLGEQLERVRKQMLDQGVRYKPTRGVRADQGALWRFSTRIAGYWWERMRAGEDDKSAISYVKMSVDEVTNTPALRGWSYDLDGEFLAGWKTVVSGVALKQATIYYRWEGEHEKEHAQMYGGGGHIEFDDDELSSGSGYYYDTNFADIAEGSHTRVKHFGLYKCDKEDEPVMKVPKSGEAKKLASSRARTLDGR
jgi:predicted nucleotide-binding protein with TIR-like domain